MKPKGTVYIGTSGFSYSEWVGEFYPKGTKPAGFLAYYAGQFNAVEINATFYRLPPAATVAAWKREVSPGFRFALKANQWITHQRDFGMTSGFFKLFLSRVERLAPRLGPVLFQFPPHFGRRERLELFMGHLRSMVPSVHKVAPVIELRNANLLTPEIIDWIRGNRIDLCLNDEFLPMERWPEPLRFGYIRLRDQPYGIADLRKVAERVRPWVGAGKDLYLFIKHEVAAPAVAKKLQGLLPG